MHVFTRLELQAVTCQSEAAHQHGFLRWREGWPGETEPNPSLNAPAAVVLTDDVGESEQNSLRYFYLNNFRDPGLGT